MYKLVWKDLLMFLTAYYLIHLVYVLLMNSDQRHVFEGLVEYTSRYENHAPLSFVLGFFVSNVVNRWMRQFLAIPYPYSVAVYVSCMINGLDDAGRSLRLTIMRYTCELE